MRQCFIVLCVMWVGCMAIAQTGAPVSALPPTIGAGAPSTNPSGGKSATTPDNTRYLDNPSLLTGCAARLTAFNDKPCDLIFIGDSITENWLTVGKDIWDRDYAPLNALNFGISGDMTQNVLWRLNNMQIQDLKPKVAVILIGTNNLDNTAHEIADGIKAVVANTQAAFGGVKIILVSILPNDRAEEKMKQVNSIIKNLADDSTVYYLDLVPLMPATTTPHTDGTIFTNWKGLSKDQLHPDPTGYQIWADAMDPLLKKLMAGG